ncbi:FadR/GntR family transcriptional regulator [Micropruina sonneratiae]|uniref:FadR/GntR family transcriptional regulator n=1 Tax=Micropruina sonneratiae TaxID=2986940 RepID=UPI002225DBFE|nr:GntR family transcriptional regulator [Micropruina sp. KQZ13P-5]MCW3156400.1 GntR family transcriptional regulator [Micropruina sp. KQZ13P-5]
MQVGSERARRTLAFLRQKITSGEWPINSKIPTEPELMRLLGVGKTTVREAVRSLASLGILEPLPGTARSSAPECRSAQRRV